MASRASCSASCRHASISPPAEETVGKCSKALHAFNKALCALVVVHFEMRQGEKGGKRVLRNRIPLDGGAGVRYDNG